jgi:hypothetical protein
MSSLWPLAPSGATDWLLELCGDGITGFMPPAMPDAVWVFNAIAAALRTPRTTTVHLAAMLAIPGAFVAYVAAHN